MARTSPTTTRFQRLWRRKRKREQDHAQRLNVKEEQLQMAKALKATWEAKGNTVEVRRLTIKIRLLRQELKYMNKGEIDT